MSGRTCTICSHDKRADIEAEIAKGVSYRVIARQFDIGHDSIQRHTANHLKESIRQSSETFDVVAQLKEVNSITRAILSEARANKKTYGLALSAIDRIQKQIELYARLSGDLDMNINIALSPEWLALQSHILKALSSYPEARLAVAEALDRAQLN